MRTALAVAAAGNVALRPQHIVQFVVDVDSAPIELQRKPDLRESIVYQLVPSVIVVGGGGGSGDGAVGAIGGGDGDRRQTDRRTSTEEQMSRSLRHELQQDDGDDDRDAVDEYQVRPERFGAERRRQAERAGDERAERDHRLTDALQTAAYPPRRDLGDYHRRHADAHARLHADDDAADDEQLRRGGDDARGAGGDADDGEDMADEDRADAADAVGEMAGEQGAEDAARDVDGGRERPEDGDDVGGQRRQFRSAAAGVGVVVEGGDNEGRLVQDGGVVAENEGGAERHDERHRQNVSIEVARHSAAPPPPPPPQRLPVFEEDYAISACGIQYTILNAYRNIHYMLSIMTAAVLICMDLTVLTQIVCLKLYFDAPSNHSYANA